MAHSVHARASRTRRCPSFAYLMIRASLVTKLAPRRRAVATRMRSAGSPCRPPGRRVLSMAISASSASCAPACQELSSPKSCNPAREFPLDTFNEPDPDVRVQQKTPVRRFSDQHPTAHPWVLRCHRESSRSPSYNQNVRHGVLDGRQFGDRLAPLGDDDLGVFVPHLIHQFETVRLELARRDCCLLHVSSPTMVISPWSLTSTCSLALHAVR